MSNKTIVHALIPARGGSKSIPKKNIRKYNNYPLIVHSIQTAKIEPIIQKVIVSTDCLEIKRISEEYGAEVPFLRPEIYSGDYSTDFECFSHYINWLKNNNKELPDIIVHLRPTYPERNEKLLYKCLHTFMKVKDKYTSLRTVIPIEKSLFKMYTIDKNNLLESTYKEYKGIDEPYNAPRQLLPTTYLHNGCIDIIKRETIENGSITGDKIYAYIMSKEETYDIDTEEDWERSLEYGKNKISKDLIIKRSKPIDIPVIPKRNRNNNDFYFYTY